jgi:endonuclease G
MKRFKYFISILFLLVIGFNFYSRNFQLTEANAVDFGKNSASNDFSSDSIRDYLPTSTTNAVIKHKYYTLSYNELHEQAEWVAYFIDFKVNPQAHYKRRPFMDDAKIMTGSAKTHNYKKSGYDRGHLCAAADMKISKSAYDETFYMSNIAPQKHDFNDGDWRRLEEKTRYWAQKYHGLYVVTGGVLQNGLKTIGSEQVTVPNYFYKILFCKSKGNYKMVGFLMPHQNKNEPLYQYVVSVDTIEKITGINFFPQLEDAVEDKLEQEINYKAWAFDSK